MLVPGTTRDGQAARHAIATEEQRGRSLGRLQVNYDGPGAPQIAQPATSG